MRGWDKSIFALHDAGNYVCASACPCIIMHDIARLLFESKGHNDTHTCIASCVSIMVDIPCVFCIGNSRERIVRSVYLDPNNNNDGGGDDEAVEEDEWDPENSSFDWWPADWCRFYTMAALESCCSWLCIGPNVSGGNFPLCFSCMAGSIYPCCICPLSCMLRRLAIHKLKIQTEGFLHTCALSTLCTPCSLIQIQEQLQSSSSSSQAFYSNSCPHTENSMIRTTTAPNMKTMKKTPTMMMMMGQNHNNNGDNDDDMYSVD